MVPAELGQDVLILDEPLPSTTHLEQIVRETFNAAELHEPERPVIDRAVDAYRRLAMSSRGRPGGGVVVVLELGLDLWGAAPIIEQAAEIRNGRFGEGNETGAEDIGGVQNAGTPGSARWHRTSPSRGVH